MLMAMEGPARLQIWLVGGELLCRQPGPLDRHHGRVRRCANNDPPRIRRIQYRDRFCPGIRGRRRAGFDHDQNPCPHGSSRYHCCLAVRHPDTDPANSDDHRLEQSDP